MYLFLQNSSHTHTHTQILHTQGEDGDDSKVKGPPGPQGDRVSFIQVLCFPGFFFFFNGRSCGCLINFHMNSGSSWNARTERRVR